MGIQINNRGYVGKSIVISNGKIVIDGRDVTSELGETKEINISVSGNLENLEVDYANKIEISGDVGKASSGSGDIDCRNITGGARTGSGDIECESINGDVQTGSGDVKAKTITGSVKTGSGDIKYSK